MKRIVCIRLKRATGKSPVERCESQVLECCGQFSPIVGFEPTDRSVLLDITGLAHLFGGERTMAEAIARELARLGFAACLAVADTIGAAWAAAQHDTMQIEKCKLQNAKCKTSAAEPTEPIFNLHFSICIFQSSSFLGSLPIESLRLPAETVRVLHELGLVSIGQLEALPRDEFLPRFGPVLLQRLDQAFGRLDEPVPACSLPPKFEAGWSAEHPTARRETIGAALEWLIARVAAMLARCGRGALRLDCRLALDCRDQGYAEGDSPAFPCRCLEQAVPSERFASNTAYSKQWHTGYAEGDSPIFAETKIGTVPAETKIGTVRNRPHLHLSLSVGLFRPTADAKRLFELVQLQLERLRIASPVTAIHVTASPTSPLEPRQQATLFDLDGRCNLGRLSLTALVERLSSRLGDRAVVGVRLRPEAQPELSWHYDPLVGVRRRCRVKGDSPLFAETKIGTVPELPPRPLRLLPRPLPLAVTSIVPDGQPLRFLLDGEEHSISRHWGPERIETGWWRGGAIGRDYFRVETAAGRRFWIFRRLRDGKWFLHGTFE